jgi:hypothetical protein
MIITIFFGAFAAIMLLGLFIFFLTKDGEGVGALFFIFLFCLVVSLVPVYTGQTSHIELMAKRQSVLTQQSYIETIKKSRYESNNSNGSQKFIIDGSIDNLKQSTVLSEFITDIAIKKSAYNSKVVTVKNKQKNRFWYWLGNAAFYDNDELAKIIVLE